MSDQEFEQSLTDYLKHFSEGNEPIVPLFRKSSGSIDRDKTLALPCFSRFEFKE